MRTSQYMLNSHHQYHNDEQLLSYNWMNKIGMVADMGDGCCSWLPMGLRVIQKIKHMINEELHANCLFPQECSFPVLYPHGLAQSLNSQTHAAPWLCQHPQNSDCHYSLSGDGIIMATDMVRRILRSPKQLPLLLFQMQNQYINMPVTNSNFVSNDVMYDGFSFHLGQSCMQGMFEAVQQAWQNVFYRCNLAVSWNESQQKIDANRSSDQSEAHALACPTKVSHIAKLIQYDTLYSDLMHVNVMDSSNHFVSLHMAGYQISMINMLQSIIYQNSDERGIIWPEELAPFQVVIVPLSYHKSYREREYADRLYDQLQQANYTVLLEDRKERPGTLFAKMDLLGIPHRIVVAEKFIDQQLIEYKKRSEDQLKLWPMQDIMLHLSGVIHAERKYNQFKEANAEIEGVC